MTQVLSFWPYRVSDCEFNSLLLHQSNSNNKNLDGRISFEQMQMCGCYLIWTCFIIVIDSRIDVLWAMILILNDLMFQKGSCGFSHMSLLFSYFFNLFSLNLFLITNTFKTFLNFHTNKQLFRPQHYLMTNRIELKATSIFFISNACFFLP